MEPEFSRTRAGSGIPTLIVCKPASVALLREEMTAKLRDSGRSTSNPIERSGQGWVLTRAPVPPRPFVFERQRLPQVRCIQGESRKALAESVWSEYAGALADGGLSLHIFAPDAGEPRSLQARANGVAQALTGMIGRSRQGEGQEERPAANRKRVRILQLCLTTQGLFVSLEPMQKLSSPHPGGVHRAGLKGRAASRSAMKIEEALEEFEESPKPGQRVIDLGAAPGGWSEAFLRRGCRVTAVDRAQLRIQDLDGLPGALEHLREDGLRFRPSPAEAPVDWLLCDMLVPPGVAQGLLRKWIEKRWTRRFVMNVKLPQRHAYSAVAPMEDYLGHADGVKAQMRQLHHDRREVTAWGMVSLEPSKKRR